MSFVDAWRRQKSAAFDLDGNSTAGEVRALDLWGNRVNVYGNANLSVYSAQTCNAKCTFCVEELRPASRGRELAVQRSIEDRDDVYFSALSEVLQALRPLDPSVSVTGGEPSKDPRLPRILKTLQAANGRKRTVTTNGSGLLDVRDGKRNIDWIAETGVKHLNISRAHPDHDVNARLMRYKEGLQLEQLRSVVAMAKQAGTRVRLSCVLLNDEIDSIDGIRDYLRFAQSIGVDNVIFRQLMKTDVNTHSTNYVVKYSDQKRVVLEHVLDQLSASPDFEFARQIMGYYYYVEVWQHEGVDVVFEEADLAQLERTKATMPDVVHELIFHPNARLASTWQPWDGEIGPPSALVETHQRNAV
jgi:cyclic pyranopterin phosphate synthase